ncbi:MAG: hypothetical protein EOP38_17695 [Rubrivivax sp.]|nr:MAG: hypothetical protein EOP38_17695 [Rubrivivax sp.]
MDSEVQASLHRRVWHVIPWVVNGTASEADQSMVHDHVRQCPDCREELAAQTRLRAAMVAEQPAMHDPGPALARLWDRIDQDEAEEPMGDLLEQLPEAEPTRRPASVAFRWTRWLAAAVVVQAVGLTVLIGMLWQQRPAPSYVTLSQAPANAAMPAIRLVPGPSLTVGELKTLLQANGLKVVETNADGGILGVALASGDEASSQAPAQLAGVLAKLRAHGGVLLAEPVGEAAAPVRAP